jgi:uncharacterized protein YbdZ (MbtH family)
MLTNRFSSWIIVLMIAALTLVAVNAYLEQRHGEGGKRYPNTYSSLPPGEQTARTDAARKACLARSYDILAISHVTNPNTYFPIPPGKQTILTDAARQACIDHLLGR